MSEQPLISIIIPVYNCEKYLKDAVNSVTEQPCGDFEIIIVNDGSTDNSLNEAEALAKADSRISVINKKNTGVSDSRNIGIDAAKGKYIAFLDSDDVMQKEFLCKEIIDLILNNDDTEMFGFNANYTDINLNLIEVFRVYNRTVCGGKDKAIDAFGHMVFCEFIYRKDMLNKYKIRFNVGQRYGEDDLFKSYALYHSNKIICKDTAILNYRSNDASTTRKKRNHKDYAEQKLLCYNYLKNFLYDRYAEEGRSAKIHCAMAAQTLAFYIYFGSEAGLGYKKIMQVCNEESVIEDIKNNSFDFHIDEYTKNVMNEFLKNTRFYYLKHRIHGLLYHTAKNIKSVICR